MFSFWSMGLWVHCAPLSCTFYRLHSNSTCLKILMDFGKNNLPMKPRNFIEVSLVMFSILSRPGPDICHNERDGHFDLDFDFELIKLWAQKQLHAYRVQFMFLPCLGRSTLAILLILLTLNLCHIYTVSLNVVLLIWGTFLITVPIKISHRSSCARLNRKAR